MVNFLLRCSPVPYLWRLREKAREAMRSGRIPSRRQHIIRSGRDGGSICPVCDELIGSPTTELEIEFSNGAAGFVTYQLHSLCFVAWDIERGE